MAYLNGLTRVGLGGPSIQYPGFAASASAAITGTLDGSTEADIVSGGKTIIITLTADTWVTGATFNAQRANIIAGLDAATSPTNGWNNEVRDSALQVTDVVRTSDTVVTITLPAVASYDISSDETITVTVPDSAVAGGAPITASPTIGISFVPVATTTTTGRSRRRRRYSVEVDNEFFVFDSISEVESFLYTVREEAKEAADQLVTTPVTPKPPRIKVKTGSGKPTTSKTLQQTVKRTQKAVNRAYIEAAKRRQVDQEISRLMLRKIEREDEEDTLIALLLS